MTGPSNHKLEAELNEFIELELKAKKDSVLNTVQSVQLTAEKKKEHKVSSAVSK
jgi:hypothetical protein